MTSVENLTMESNISEENNTLHIPMTYIYDDTEKYLDFVAHRIFYEMAQKRQLIFVSKNIELETLMKFILQNELADSALYDVHYYYQTLEQFFDFFKQPYEENIIPFITSVCPDHNYQQITLILDLGSFFDSPFKFSEFLHFLKLLPSSPLILPSLDSRLLAPSQLSLALSHCPSVSINNVPLKIPPSQKIPTRTPTNLEINSSLLNYAQNLAKSSDINQMVQIKSLANLKNMSKTFSRAEFDNEMGDSSWQISDKLATHLGTSVIDLTIMETPQLNITPRMRRMNSRAGAKMNWSSQQLVPKNESTEGDIEIKLQ